MGLGELFVIAVGLSMDAFAVSICKGLSVKRVCPGHVLCTGVYFGGFQMMMPLIGYFLGSQFSHLITRVDHWINIYLEEGDSVEILRCFSSDTKIEIREKFKENP